MNTEAALRLIELLVVLAIFQRGLEHLRSDPCIFLPQMACAALLFTGFAPFLAALGLWVFCMAQLRRFSGPYNGGADKMMLLIVTCLCLAHTMPDWATYALGYLAIQLVLSYFISGWAKLLETDWRTGDALRRVFAYSAYPTSQNLRFWANRPVLMKAGAWGVIGFELSFPALILHPVSFAFALVVGLAFHLANAFLFGLNRFVWAWAAAYPSLIWFQGLITA